MKGWLVLDIDGTITSDIVSVPKQVVSYLRKKEKEGWGIMLITGRMYAFAAKSLKSFDFPYILGLQNGADILRMPDKRLVDRKYLPRTAIELVDKAYENLPEDFLIYAGYDHGDFCYYRKNNFSEDMLQYLESLKNLTPQRWLEKDNFNFSDEHSFPLIKGFGLKHDMEKLGEILEKQGLLNATVIKDTIGENLYLTLITHKDATKGEALKRIKQMFNSSGKIIAAGNDLNDLSMLQEADIAIAVGPNSPKILQDAADIVSASAADLGIIEALDKAIKSYL